jgi:hypothetical protein
MPPRMAAASTGEDPRAVVQFLYRREPESFLSRAGDAARWNLADGTLE